MKYLVTGCAGFIGSNVAQRLLEDGHEVVGIDFACTTESSSKQGRTRPDVIRKQRVQVLRESGLTFINVSIGFSALRYILRTGCDAIFHFAATPGVRNSFDDTAHYIDNNIRISCDILRATGETGIPRIIMASSSSVYGDSGKDDTLPISPYAMTKRAMEMAAHVYHKRYGTHICLPRYFTVYGPNGRPDMAYSIFMRQLQDGNPITVFGDGSQYRDFTYIDDVVSATVKMVDLVGYNIMDIGSGHPRELIQMIRIIAKEMGISNPEIRYTHKNQPGDVHGTHADISKAKLLLNWKPEFDLERGLALMVKDFLERNTIQKGISCDGQEDHR